VPGRARAGNIATSQSDYFLATRGGGHGDGRCITYSPSTLQELYDLCAESFEIATLPAPGDGAQ